jgi:predicted permease
MRDLRNALRTVARNPRFAILFVATVALGIGTSVAIFTAVDAVLFRPLAVRDAGSLVRIYATDVEGSEVSNSSYPVYTDYRDGATSFAGVAAFDDAEPLHLSTGGGKPERLVGAIVSGNYFEVLGVRAARGRLLTAEDDRAPGASPVVVLGDRVWRRRFGASPSAVGATVSINGHPFTIVGVAPRGFAGVNLDSLPELWVPMSMAEQALPELADDGALRSRHLSWLDIVARVKPGAFIQRAQAELDTIAKNRAAAQPKDQVDPMASVRPAADFAVGPDARGEARRVSWLLLGMAGLVLLIACADAAGLLLLRGDARRREIGVRVAVGASRRQIASQLLAESLVLAALAAAAGLLVAVWSSDALVSAVPPEFALPMGAALSALDPRSIAFAAGVALFSALLFGVLPAVRAGRLDVARAIKSGDVSGGPARTTLRDGLVVAQIVLTVVLLVGAGLMGRTLAREAAVGPGFDPAGRLEASMDLARQGYDPAHREAFFDELLRRARALPGVRSAALARTVPIQSAGMRTTIESDGYTAAPGEFPAADLNPITPDYFRTLGIPLLAGRDFEGGDRRDGPAVAIVNEAMARKFWPGRNPLGRQIKNLGPPGVGGEVVGVVADVRYRSLRRPADPTVYVPSSQFSMPRMTLVLSAERGDATALQRPLQAIVAALDPGLPLFHVRTLSEKLGLALGQTRVIAGLVGVFGALALLLAAAGLYGVVSYATQRRTREFGIRLALVASAASVRRLVLSKTGRLAAAGLVLGLAAAAGALPARRAGRVDPMTSLRSE